MMRERVLVIALLAASIVSVGCGEVVPPSDIDAAIAVDAPSTIDACMPMAETCNHANDDCDLATDEDFDFQRDRMNCGDCGVTCTMLQTCNNGCVALGSITFD